MTPRPVLPEFEIKMDPQLRKAQIAEWMNKMDSHPDYPQKLIDEHEEFIVEKYGKESPVYYELHQAAIKFWS